MKKIIMLILMCFLISGCSLDYQLEIINGNFNESMDILGNKNDSIFNEDVIEHIKKWPYPVYSYIPIEAEEPIKSPGEEYYEPKFFDDTKYGVNLAYKYNKNNYKYATIPNKCFDSFNTYIEDNIIFVATSPNFRCFNFYPLLETVNITIKTNHVVDSTNSIDIKNDEDYYYYTWNINKETSNEIKINLMENKYINDTHEKEEEKKENKILSVLKKTKGPFIIAIYVIIAAIPISFIIFIISKRSSNKNKL